MDRYLTIVVAVLIVAISAIAWVCAWAPEHRSLALSCFALAVSVFVFLRELWRGR